MTHPTLEELRERVETRGLHSLAFYVEIYSTFETLLAVAEAAQKFEPIRQRWIAHTTTPQERGAVLAAAHELNESLFALRPLLARFGGE